MNVKQITVDQQTAQREYEAYREALKTKKDAFLHDLKVAYGHMRHGRSVLDVWQAFADTGLDANGDPKIAIARADWREVRFRKFNEPYGWWTDIGFQGIFSDKDRTPHPALDRKESQTFGVVGVEAVPASPNLPGPLPPKEPAPPPSGDGETAAVCQLGAEGGFNGPATAASPPVPRRMRRPILV